MRGMRRVMLTALLALALGLLASPGLAAERAVRLAYVEWSTEIASSYLIKAVIEERLGMHCELVPANAEMMWRAVAEGRADASVSAWLPKTHAHYMERYGDALDNLGPNLEGARTGIVIPNVTSGRFTAGSGLRNRPYMDIESIAELGDHAEKLKGRIIGIDPEAGIMRQTREAIKAYNLDLRLVEGSEPEMIAELSHAIRRQEWIAVTGWLPHWIFARWNLKFLDDPKNIFGDAEHIATIARQGLENDMPKVHALLDNFQWRPEEMGQLMLWIQHHNGMFPYEEALRWVRTNPERVDAWLGL